MQYEEEDYRNHPERWQQGSGNRRPRPAFQEPINDFSSRWNEPVPPLHSYRHERLDERKRFKNDGETWNQQRPHPTRHQADPQRDQYEQWYQSRHRQQEQNAEQHRRPQHEEERYYRKNQSARDRWNHQDDFILREEELRRRNSREFRDWEEEDRRRRRH